MSKYYFCYNKERTFKKRSRFKNTFVRTQQKLLKLVASGKRNGRDILIVSFEF